MIEAVYKYGFKKFQNKWKENTTEKSIDTIKYDEVNGKK